MISNQSGRASMSGCPPRESSARPLTWPQHHSSTIDRWHSIVEDPQQIREFADDITRRTNKNTDCSLAFRNCIEIANVPNSTTSCRHGLESRDADEDTDYFMRTLSSPSCRTAPTCPITITRPFMTQSTEP